VKRLILCLILSLAPVVLAQEPQASGNSKEPTSDPWIWWKWANFALLAGVLGYLANKHAGSYFRGQTEEIQRGIVEAGKMKAEAEAQAARIAQRLSGIQSEIDQLRAYAHTEMAAEAERLKNDTKRAVERQLQQTQQELELMAKAARHELKGFSADLALGLAEQRIRASLNAGSQDGLVNAFIKDLHQGEQHRSITQ
jgi:F0F1-type ATP synthase membrane subunit b/b'